MKHETKNTTSKETNMKNAYLSKRNYTLLFTLDGEVTELKTKKMTREEANDRNEKLKKNTNLSWEVLYASQKKVLANRV